MPEERKPDWLETPDEAAYAMGMLDHEGGTVQDVEMSRDEYIALKEHLAKLRGFSPVKPEASLAA